jgi:hypothetical protein
MEQDYMREQASLGEDAFTDPALEFGGRAQA